jgi:hypothetical protein
LIVLPRAKNSRRIRAIVSTPLIPNHPILEPGRAVCKPRSERISPPNTAPNFNRLLGPLIVEPNSMLTFLNPTNASYPASADQLVALIDC